MYGMSNNIAFKMKYTLETIVKTPSIEKWGISSYNGNRPLGIRSAPSQYSEIISVTPLRTLGQGSGQTLIPFSLTIDPTQDHPRIFWLLPPLMMGPAATNVMGND